MKKILFSLVITFGLLIANHSASAQDHGHFYIGATGKAQGAQLIITNAADFSTNSGYHKTLTYTNGGPYAGYFEGNITYEAKAATNALGDEVPGGPALGSWIYGQITSVDGPAGGVFSFWDAGATNATINILCGTTSTNTWVVSNNGGAAGTDPFGHIHGRRFTATKPGFYTIGFKAVDRSTNGIGGRPIHTDSDVLKVYFQAGFNILSLTREENVSTAKFGGLTNRTFYLEANSDLSNTNWTSVGSVAGNDFFLSLSETNANSPRFYRLRITPP